MLFIWEDFGGTVLGTEPGTESSCQMQAIKYCIVREISTFELNIFNDSYNHWLTQEKDV